MEIIKLILRTIVGEKNKHDLARSKNLPAKEAKRQWDEKHSGKELIEDLKEAIEMNRKDLRYCMNELKSYLESHFYPYLITGETVTWDNYRYKGRHVGHKYPIVKGLKEGKQKEVINYRNLDTELAELNMKKNDKIIEGLLCL